MGGGFEKGESHIAFIDRECIEEAGYMVSVKDKICSVESYAKHPTIGYFHPIQTYYIGEMISKEAEPVEKDHEFLWIEYEKLKGNMFAEMQNWALEPCYDDLFDKKNARNLL